jgi:hypothetical protein
MPNGQAHSALRSRSTDFRSAQRSQLIPVPAERGALLIYLLTGQPGTGKSTLLVEHAINRYAAQGRRVACNFPIDFAPVCRRPDSLLSRASCQVIPDRPTRADLDLIGYGSEIQREEHFGLLAIDEAGVWLNSRSWAGQEREKLIDWLSQSRKRCWDIILVAQGTDMIDKQVRNAIVEGVVKIRRTDRLRILGVKLPRVHIGIARYGVEANAPVIERWFYRGADAHRCFGSYRLFGADAAHYSVLPATQTKWPYVRRFELAKFLAALWQALGFGPDGGKPMGWRQRLQDGRRFKPRWPTWAGQIALR